MDSNRKTGSADAPAGRPRPRSTLNSLDWLVRVPIGLSWLGVLLIAAVPVFLCMTVLYWIAQGASYLPGRRRGGRSEPPRREERVA